MSVKTILFATLNLKSKSTGDIETIYVTERPTDGANVFLQDMRSIAWPILKSANSFGSAMNNYLPNASNGALILDCSRESFGYERRLIDLFERYTIQNQECKLSIAQVDSNLTPELPINNPDYSITLLMRGWSHSPSSQTVSISLSGGSLTSSVVSYSIKRSITFDSGGGTLTMPAESIGRSLPVIFGRDVQAASFRLADAKYGYAVLPETHSYNASNYKCLLPNLNNEYVEIESKVNTNILGKTYASGAGHTVFDVSTNYTKVAYPFTLTERALVNKIGVYLDSAFTGAVSGAPNQVALDLCLADGDAIPPGLTIEAYSGGNLAPGTVIAGGFTPVEFTLPATEMIVSFANPVVLEANTLYWIVWDLEKDRQYSATWTKEVYFRDNFSNSFGDVRAFFTLAGLNQWESIAIFEGNQIRCYYSVYGIAITDENLSVGFDNERVPRVITFTNSTDTTLNGTRSVGGVIPTNLNNLKPVVVRTQGLLDTSTGTVTGSNNALIEKPEHVAKMISRLRDPSGIIADEIDTTYFQQVSTTTSDYDYRIAAGAFQGRTTYEKALNELCRSTQTRIARRGDGLHFFAEGIRYPTVTRYEDSECRVISIREFNGAQTIVNNCEIYFRRSIINSDVTQGASDGRFQNYEFNAIAKDGSSINIYGEREILVEAMEMIGDEVSGDRVSRILVDKWSQPAVYVDMAVPLALARGVDLLDIVEIVSAELHAFYGTSFKAKKPTFGGDLVDQGGMYEKRAKRWRGIVEARDISGFEGGATELIFTVRLFAPNDINF